MTKPIYKGRISWGYERSIVFKQFLVFKCINVPWRNFLHKWILLLLINIGVLVIAIISWRSVQKTTDMVYLPPTPPIFRSNASSLRDTFATSRMSCFYLFCLVFNMNVLLFPSERIMSQHLFNNDKLNPQKSHGLPLSAINCSRYKKVGPWGIHAAFHLSLSNHHDHHSIWHPICVAWQSLVA